MAYPYSSYVSATDKDAVILAGPAPGSTALTNVKNGWRNIGGFTFSSATAIAAVILAGPAPGSRALAEVMSGGTTRVLTGQLWPRIAQR